MIRHIVTIQLNDDTADETVESVVAELAALKTKISAIDAISVGRDVKPGRGHAIGLIVDTKNLETLDEYRMHPEHRKVVDHMIKPNLAAITGVDIDIA